MESLESKTFSSTPDELFPELLKLVQQKFKIKSTEKHIRTVEISTGMSLFSFGESFVIIVSDYKNGSIVRIKGKSKIKWNITNDVKGKIVEIFDLLDDHHNTS